MITAEYITKPGDRWDLIAHKAYGTTGEITLEDSQKVNAIAYIVQNNPSIPLDSIIPEALLLQIPIIPDTIVNTAAGQLPPWK